MFLPGRSWSTRMSSRGSRGNAAVTASSTIWWGAHLGPLVRHGRRASGWLLIGAWGEKRRRTLEERIARYVVLTATDSAPHR